MTKPNRVKYKGIEYKLNDDFQTFLDVVWWIDYGNLDDIDQAIMLVDLMYGTHAPVEQPLVDYAMKFLLMDKDASTDKGKRDMDLFQDYPIYRADIIREYGIDIAEDKISLEKVWTLIGNLSNDSRLTQVREVRTKDLSTVKDRKEREQWRKAQEFYSLEEIVSDDIKEEREQNKAKVQNFLEQFK